MKVWARRLAAGAAIAYLVALIVIALLLRFVGERWWVTDIGLYLPRVGFLLPLPFTVAALCLFGPRRLLYTQLAAFLIAVFPMMGFVVGLPTKKRPPSIRVMSFNVNSLYDGVDDVVGAIASYSPDIVLAEEIFDNERTFKEKMAAHYPVVALSTQFLVASRFPIVSTLEPPKIPHDGRGRSPRFIRYVMRTPLGEVAVYIVHPISPRYGMYVIRGHGLRKEILSGRFFKAERTGALQEDSMLRVRQIEAFAAMASAEKRSVIVGGDTNLPTLSPALSNLSSFDDGFPSAGFGFGYTYPGKRPWMRIDRILASHDLAFSSFTVGCNGASDHLCVVADLQRR